MEVEVTDGTFILPLKLLDGLETALKHVCMDCCKIFFALLELADPGCDDFGCSQRISKIQNKEISASYVKW